MRYMGLVVGLSVALGCGSEAPVPDKPTWAEDVQPILQGNCFQCHGAPLTDYDYNKRYNQTNIKRWDVFDINEAPYATLGFGEVSEDIPLATVGVMTVKTFLAGGDAEHCQVLIGYVAHGAGLLQRPPPPATLLSARDLDLLQKWCRFDPVQGACRGAGPKGSHHPNHKPTIAWVKKPTLLEVADVDGDQVLGKLDCGGTMVSLPRSGAHPLPAGATPPCTGQLYDGYDDLVDVSLR